MSSDKSFLALHLESPLQSWGFVSKYNRRTTGLMPTKSAIAGICCAALGLPRGSNNEKEFLNLFGAVRMTSIAIPRNISKNELPVRRLDDFHTIQYTKTADGKIKDCHITYRQYLMDAKFGILIEGGANLLYEISTALVNPKWGVWFGRKTCIPSAPVFVGLKESREDALHLLIGEKPLQSFTRQEEVENFIDGRDSLPDTPISFASERRMFSPRRVRTLQGKEQA